MGWEGKEIREGYYYFPRTFLKYKHIYLRKTYILK